MESLLEPVELNRETTQTLDEIRSGAENALYGAAPADAEEKVNRYVLPLIEGAGMPNLHVIHYRWYLRELARHWRTRKGRDLAFHLELCVRKWVHLGLEPRTLQFLICEAHQRLKGGDMTELAVNSDRVPSPMGTAKDAKIAKAEPDSTTKTQSHEEAGNPAKTGTVPHAECSEGLSPAFAPETQSAESAKSVDVRSGPGPDTGILESSTPRPLSGNETAKAAKTAKAEPDSVTRPLDSLNPGVLS